MARGFWARSRSGRKLWALLVMASFGTMMVARNSIANVSLIVHPQGTTELFTVADNRSGGNATEKLFPTGVPYSYLSTRVDGSCSATSQFTLNSDGFSFTFEHTRDGTFDSVGYSGGRVFFTPAQDLFYSISGRYSTVDPEGRNVELHAYIYDLTALGYVFQSRQVSTLVPNESFTLGHRGGNLINTLNGSTTGSLLAGRAYAYYHIASLNTQPAPAASLASGIGHHTLKFCSGIGTRPRSTAKLGVDQDNYCEDWSGVEQPAADISRAMLRLTGLADANLAGALLIEADLADANLSGADLGSADIAGAILDGALYDHLTLFPSGNTYDTPPWGLDQGISPWEAGMIPAPEPSSVWLVGIGVATLACLAMRRGRA